MKKLKPLQPLQRPTLGQFKDRYRKSIQAAIQKSTAADKDILADVVANETQRFLKLP